jgi:hypothetical protein
MPALAYSVSLKSIDAIFGARGFTPSALFSSGEQGAWYDPSDFSTMFQDAAGTTPVTAVEQPVGLLLDKSKGLALGAELVTNGDFSSSTGWTLGAGWTITGGKAVATAVSAFVAIDQSVSIVSGKRYWVTCDTTVTAGGAALYLGAAGDGPVEIVMTATGSYRKLITATATATLIIRARASGFTGTIDNVTVNELPGNHASQSTSASRPVLSARVNLLQYTEDFSNAYWSKSAFVTVSQAGSVGTISVPSTVGSGTNIFFKQSISPFANGPTATARIEVRCTTGQSISLASDTGVTTVTMTAEWQTITLTSTIASSFHQFYIRTAVGSQTYSFDIRYADLRVTNDGVGLPAYQRVTTSTDYDTSGFPLYLRFDGTDDSLATASIDFSATDKMSVFAGVRKLSDAATGAICELSSDASTNTSVFAMHAPNTAVAVNYRLFYRDNAAATTSIGPSAGYPAPVTNVLTGTINIAGASQGMRLNGVSVSTSATSLGTGNFGNYPLYIGRRGGASLPYNGRLYSLIVRGAQSTDAQIASTETWVNNVTKGY